MNFVNKIRSRDMSEKHIIQIDEETEKHDTTRHLERIDRIFFSQYMKDDADTYVITYNKTHNSIVGWTVDIKNDGKKTPDKFYKLEQLNVPYDIKSFAMYSEKLSLCYCVKKDGKEYYKQCRYFILTQNNNLCLINDLYCNYRSYKFK